jgi:L-asparaginase
MTRTAKTRSALLGDPEAQPLIAVYGTGGTIVSTRAHGSEVSPNLSIDELIVGIPSLQGAARLRTVDFRHVPSVELKFRDIIALGRSLADDASDGVDGFVVVQGTDTIEETAFALNLLWTRSEPVVVTGAMRPGDAPGADGPANLLSAVKVAAAAESASRGVLVVLNDEVHDPRFVRKTHTSALGAFKSHGMGLVGVVQEGRVLLRAKAVSRSAIIDLNSSFVDAVVGLYTVGLGEDGRMLLGLAEHGYRGLVVEGMGGGHVPSVLVEPLTELARDIPVVLASRTGAGLVLEGTYGFPGSETDLLGRGLISAGGLDGLKARVLLTLMLMAASPTKEIREAFDSFARLS